MNVRPSVLMLCSGLASACGGETLDIGSTSSPAPCARVTLYSDDFSDPESLANYEFPFGRDHAIVDGVLRQTARPGIELPDSVDSVALVRAELLGGASDFAVEAEARIRDRTNLQGAFGLAFRGAPTGEHYSFLWNGNVENDVPHWQVEKSYDLELDYSYIGGSFGGGESEPEYALGAWAHLKVETRGARARAYVDLHDGAGSVLVYDVEDGQQPFAGGSVGFRSGWLYEGNFVEFDDFVVSELCP